MSYELLPDDDAKLKNENLKTVNDNACRELHGCWMPLESASKLCFLPPTHPSICPAIHASEIWQQLLAWRSLYNNTLNSQLTKSGSDTSKRDMRKVSTRRCVDFHEILCELLICSCGSWGASVVSCHPLGRLSWGRVCNRLSTSSYKFLDNMQTIDACLYDILVVLYTRVRIAPSFGTKRHFTLSFFAV